MGGWVGAGRREREGAPPPDLKMQKIHNRRAAAASMKTTTVKPNPGQLPEPYLFANSPGAPDAASR